MCVLSKYTYIFLHIRMPYHVQGKPTKEHLNPLALMLEFIPTPQHQEQQPQQPASPVSPTVSKSVSSEPKLPKKLVKGQHSMSSSALQGTSSSMGGGNLSLPASKGHLGRKNSSTLPRVMEEPEGVPKKRSFSTTSRPVYK